MAINRGTDGMREAFTLVEVRALRAADDQELLRRFVEANDEAAFRVIAERHGPMVLGVCRRVLSCPDDAEDALQATFLVFARKAASVRSITSLAGWLHRVATRMATTLRRERRRRQSREQAATPPTVGEPRDELSWAEVKCALDEELAQLSVGYREVLVLCCLEGLTRDEAAQRLGVAVGVVKGRLERARKALAGRLIKRGLTLSAGFFAIAVSSQVAAVSVRVSALVSGSPALSPDVLTLANSVLKGMTMSQLRLSATGLLAVAALVAGIALGLAQPVQGGRVLRGGEPIKAPVPKAPPPEGVIVVSRTSLKPPGDILEVMGTDGKHHSYLPVGDLSNVQRARVSPDGQRLAFVRFIPLNGNQRGNHEYPQDVFVVDLPIKGAPTEPTFKALLDPQVAWAPDGKTLFVSSIPDDTNMKQAAVAGQLLPRKTVMYDVAAKKEKEIELPKGHTVQDVSPDSKTLLTRIKVWNGGFGKTAYSSFLVPLDTLKPQAIGDEDEGFEIARFSPDGTRVVGIRPELSKSKENGVFVTDVATGKIEQVPLAKEVAAGVDCVAWAPDSKRLAVMWRGPAKGGRPTVGGAGGPVMAKRITVVGTDGKDEKVIREFAPNDFAMHIDWADPKLPDPEKKDEPKAKPPMKELIKAPVPAVKEETMGLKASVTPEKKEIMLGEPTYFAFTVENPTDKSWGFDVGGDYRNRLGRPNSFKVEVTGPDGKAVPQPDSGPDMGGISTGVNLPKDGVHTFTLFLPHWATFDKPGEYTISVRRKLTLVPLDPAEREKVKPETATVVGVAKITVTKADAKKFGDLIDTLGVDLLNPERSDRATKMLLEIRDERVIPHFVKLGQRPRVEPRYAACEGLKKFKSDEAFAALKAMTATTADDLKGTAINRDLEESSARAVRHAAISALADCPHPDALPLVWKAANDESEAVRITVLHKAFKVKSAEARAIIAKLAEDTDERVRNEAKRYADLLAKEKK